MTNTKTSPFEKKNDGSNPWKPLAFLEHKPDKVPDKNLCSLSKDIGNRIDDC